MSAVSLTGGMRKTYGSDAKPLSEQEKYRQAEAAAREAMKLTAEQASAKSHQRTAHLEKQESSSTLSALFSGVAGLFNSDYQAL